MTSKDFNSSSRSLIELTFHPVSNAATGDTVAVLLLNRVEARNALNTELMDAIKSGIKEVSDRKKCRVLVLGGKGNHFSAGADLLWMKESAKLSHEENIRDANLLTELFESFVALKIPTVGVIKGAAYGGAVGLAACCDVTIALETTKFCLSEAKLGLAPAIIMPYLMRKMHAGQLRRLALSAKTFSGSEAKEFGLVEVCSHETALDEVVRIEINALLNCGPNAQGKIKSLMTAIGENGMRQGPYTAEAIASLRTSADGQGGLHAYFSKTDSPWNVSISNTWSFNALSC